MTPIYLEYIFEVSPKNPAVEILIAELSEVGFDSFVETDKGLEAYVQKELFDAEGFEDIFILKSNEFTITYTVSEIEQVNWNQEWEKNFNPIVVDEKCTVRAPFHNTPKTDFEIVIEPKMSFGTGHHATTYMMIQHILKLDVANKSVLDMGCGTGVLAILAAMKGAKPVDAIDIDNWCYLNSIENCERNHTTSINVYEGDVTLLKDKKYDVIIANINRNILLKDIPTYASCLNKNGGLLLSGFYSEDIPIINNKCEAGALKFVENLEKDNWVAVKYVN